MSPGPHDLDGSCHCGQIKFIAKGVGFDDIHKCNCSWCIKVGLFHVVVGDKIILSGEEPVVLSGHQPYPAGYEDKLQFYLSCGEQKSSGRWYSCSKCHIFVFTTQIGGEGCTVSLRSLDFTGSGTSLKDLTRSERIRYDDMGTDVEQNRTGEPFEGGEW